MHIFCLELEHLGELDVCSVTDASQRYVRQHKNGIYLFFKIKIKKRFIEALNNCWNVEKDKYKSRAISHVICRGLDVMCVCF